MDGENIRDLGTILDIERDIAEVHRRLDELAAEFERLRWSRDNLLGMLKHLNARKRALLEGRPLPVF